MSLKKSSLKRISQILNNEYLMAVPKRILNALEYRVRGYFYAKVFNVKNMRIGSCARIIGTKRITLGNNFSACRMLWLEAVVKHLNQSYTPEIFIGNNVSLSDLVHIASIGKITIGDDVLIGSKVLITDHNHGQYTGTVGIDFPHTPPNKRLLSYAGPITIENNVFIGDGAILMGGVHIGAGCIIAAGAFLKAGTCIPSNCIVAGNPAKIVKKFEVKTGGWRRCPS